MNKEILEAARHCVEDRCCSDCIYFNEEDDTITLLINCHEKFSIAIYDHHNKYRWHDLRKDPDDLPTEYTRNFECVELWFDGDKTVSIGTASYISECAFGKSLSESYEVIAWREIDLEPFESEDSDG